MNEIKLLTSELELMLDNIRRLDDYIYDNQFNRPYHSLVVGELKHRAVALKQRLTLISKLSTSTLVESIIFNKKSTETDMKLLKF